MLIVTASFLRLKILLLLEVCSGLVMIFVNEATHDSPENVDADVVHLLKVGDIADTHGVLEVSNRSMGQRVELRVEDPRVITFLPSNSLGIGGQFLLELVVIRCREAVGKTFVIRCFPDVQEPLLVLPKISQQHNEKRASYGTAFDQFDVDLVYLMNFPATTMRCKLIDCLQHLVYCVKEILVAPALHIYGDICTICVYSDIFSSTFDNIKGFHR